MRTLSLSLILVVSSFMPLSFAADPSWQFSEMISVQLGVRDKYGELGTYEAFFIVKDQKGRELKTNKQVKPEDWAFVYFPDDFNVYAEPGKYTWKCLVNNKEVVSGEFLYESVGSHADRARVFRENYFN